MGMGETSSPVSMSYSSGGGRKKTKKARKSRKSRKTRKSRKSRKH
jgi:hypothetical protein